MPVRPLHDAEHLLDVAGGHILVEEIAHGVHEDRPGLPPTKRQIKHLGLQGQLEPVCVVRLAHGLKALSHGFRIAMQAARADLGATCDRIPGSLSPLDRRMIRHGYPFFRIWPAILTAKSAPLGFPTAKKSRNNGWPREFINSFGFGATCSNTP